MTNKYSLLLCHPTLFSNDYLLWLNKREKHSLTYCKYIFLFLVYKENCRSNRKISSLSVISIFIQYFGTIDAFIRPTVLKVHLKSQIINCNDFYIR